MVHECFSALLEKSTIALFYCVGRFALMSRNSKTTSPHQEPGHSDEGDAAHDNTVHISFCGRPAQVNGGVLNLYALFGHNDFVPIRLSGPKSERSGVQRHAVADGCYHVEAGSSFSAVASHARRSDYHRVAETATKRVSRTVAREKPLDEVIHNSDDDVRPVVKVRGRPKAAAKGVTSSDIIEAMRASKRPRGETQAQALHTTLNDRVKSSLELLKPSISMDEEDVPITLPRRYGNSPQPEALPPIAQRSGTTRSPILAAPSVSRPKPDTRGSRMNSAAFPARGDSSAAELRSGLSASMPAPAADRQAPSPSPAPFVAPMPRAAADHSVAKRSSSLSRAVAAAPRVDADSTDDDRPLIATTKDSRGKSNKKGDRDTHEPRVKKGANEKHLDDRRIRSQPTVHQQPPSAGPLPRRSSPLQSAKQSSLEDSITASIIGMKQPSKLSQSSSDPPSFLLPPQKAPPAKRQRSPSTPPQLRPDDSFHRDRSYTYNGIYRGQSIDESPALGFTRVDTKLTQFSLDPSEDTDSD
jgi:hypothetical protein